MATEHLQWGVSPLCWTNDVLEDLGGDIPLDTCLREAREAGYQGIELGRKFPRQASTLGPLLAAADLRLASGWYSGLLAERSVEAELEAVREHAQLLRQLGARVMVYGECGQLPGETPLDEPISLSPPLSRVSLAAYCHKLNTFADLLLRDYGLQLAYHHHLMMLVEHDDELERFLSHTHDNVGLAFDTGHAFVAGVDIQAGMDFNAHQSWFGSTMAGNAVQFGGTYKGEGGLFGHEEATIIAPAIVAARDDHARIRIAGVVHRQPPHVPTVPLRPCLFYQRRQGQ